MNYLALVNIGKLYTGQNHSFDNCSLLIESDRIKEIHFSPNFPHDLDKDQIIDVKGSIITPGLIDGHTHPVFDGSRSFELEYKLQGLSYTEIAQRGGGINYTTQKTRNASKEILKKNLVMFCDKAISTGTTTAEIKTGYHLFPEGELEALEIIKEVNDDHPLELIPTFLGAHLVPDEYKSNPEVYVNKLNELMPKLKDQNIAQFVDVFCDKGAFTVDQTLSMIDCAIKHNFPIRLHGEEIERTGITQEVANKYGGKWIKSIDHLLKATKEDFELMAKKEITATFMPVAPIVLFDHSWPDYTIFSSTEVNVGLGSDFNPNSWFYSMQNVMSFATYFMKVPPLTTLTYATKNNADSLLLKNKGLINEGEKADLCIFGVNKISEIPYQIGSNNVLKVIKNGKIVYDVNKNIEFRKN